MSDLVKLLKREPFTRLTRRYLSLAATGKVTPAEFLLLTFVADRTVSWSQLWQELSFTELQEGTGLSRSKVSGALQALRDGDLVVRKSVGRSYAYALVPVGLTGADVLAICDVDNPVVVVQPSVASDYRHRSTHATDPGSYTYSSSKKLLKKASGHVDGGMRSKAVDGCDRCHGEGWLVAVADDGFTESVARCPCTQ